jgi:ubiquinone/menaquinone biosynthesis C-methylase UbiE
MNDDLASGFQDVDRAADFAVFSSCLTLVESIPFFAECKREGYDLLGAGLGRRILDVGCGLGDDAAALAKLVTPGGTVVGVDGCRAMIEPARARYSGVEGLTFEVADAMPFDEASFDGCQVDRVLQHVADPAPVIREMVHVLRPNGVLVAYDNDWETLTVGAADRVLTRTVLNAWCDRFPSGWIGRRLVPLFLQAGLDDLVTFPKTLDFGTPRAGGGRSALSLLRDSRAPRGRWGRQQGGRGAVVGRPACRRWRRPLLQLVHRVLGARDAAEVC